MASKSGILTETKIEESDIQTFAQICVDNINQFPDEVIQCIYLRRHFEIINDFGEEYNYIANLLHARAVPIKKTDIGDVGMTAEEISAAEYGIKKYIPEFDYSSILSIIEDKSKIKDRFLNAEAGYDKLQLYRIFREVHCPSDGGADGILRKFVNESFHIENEYVMQLNPHKFDNVPEYVVDECERLVISS